jgi:hypothetical protein
MKPENRQNNRSFLANHLTLLAIAILLASGLYLYFWNTTTALVGGIVLLLAHVAVAAGVVLLARAGLVKAFRKLHGLPSEPEEQG